MKKEGFIFLGISFFLLVFLICCKKEKENVTTLASILTLPVTNIKSNSAISGGNITNDGGAPISQRGIVWSTLPNPTTASNSTSDGSGTGNYTSNLSGLNFNTTYYLRAYATNSAGTAYGEEINFKTSYHLNPNLSYGSMSDQDGNTYPTIVIGTQEWMAENLRTNTYRNGDIIPNVTDYTPWWNLNTGAWSYYENNNQYNSLYGKLYNWYAVTDARNLCPTGWHIPTDAEWSVLRAYLGGGTAGRKMKTIGTEYWENPNFDATNESGFSGLPGGFRYFSGSYTFIGKKGGWWSSTENDSANAWMRSLYHTDNSVYRGDNDKNYGYSVRCLKD
jgi:uncharacterized protein (TIGR02145 family)